MALYVLLVAHGLTVNFHFCTEDHHLMSSFGDASEQCVHCLGHHHHDAHGEGGEALDEVLHFAVKCCCEDFDSEIAFSDSFTFSTEKSLMVFLPLTMLSAWYHLILEENDPPFFHGFVQEKTTYLLSGRLRTIFFSNLKLNPLVF